MISFKSVGQTVSNITTQQAAIAVKPLPIGIVTPLDLGDSDEGLLAMHYNVGDQMKNNLRDLLMTNWGERVGVYDYGGNLGPLVTEYENGKDAFDNACMQRIMYAVNKWMPYVTLESFDSNKVTYTNQIGLGAVILLVDYSIPRAQIPKTRLQISFAVS